MEPRAEDRVGDPDRARTAKPLPDHLLGRYRLERRIGGGGMGEVFLARDELLSRPVALKHVVSSGADSARARRAMLREARRASQINDRQIAGIHDVLELDGDIVIVMEFVEGVTLRQRLEQGPLTLDQFWTIALQCVEGVAAAHAHGVVHRDLKPENLMVTPQGEIKVLDFGIAKRTVAAAGSPAATLTETTAFELAGTPHYMAPEAYLGGRVDERTDLFSLGVVLYEMLAGRRPFEGANYAIVVNHVLSSAPVPVAEHRREAGGALSDVVDRLLAKNPADRFASALELRAALERAREGAPSRQVVRRAPRPATRAPAWNRAARIAPWVVLVAAGVLWGWWRVAAGPALPRERNVAVVAPRTLEAGDDFSSFALGAIEQLSARLQKQGTVPGFQIASFPEGWDEGVGSAADARQVLGANLALMPEIEQRPDAFHARLVLYDTARERVVASREIRTPASEPFAFLDRLYGQSAEMLALGARDGDSRAELGVRGAGTLRFLLQGRGRLRAKDTEAAALRALADFELACRAEPEAAAAVAGRGAAEYRMYAAGGGEQWLSRCEASARKAIAIDSNRVEGYRVLGSALGRKQDPEGALAALRRAASLLPTDADLCSRVGRAWSKVGRTDREREVYLAAIRRCPHSWQPYWWLATWYFREGRVEEAIAAYEQMVQRSPDLHKGHSSLGGLLVLHGDYPRAIESLKRAIALRPTKVAFDNLGTAYFNSGRLRDAIDCYNQSFQFGFADYESWLNLGDAYFWLRERPDLARDAYLHSLRLGREEIATRAAQGRSDDVMIPANLATVFPRVGEPDSARVYLARATAADSANPMVEYCAALTHWQLGDRSGAVAWIGRAVRHGYPTVWLRDSPIFREWRAIPEFRALLEAKKSAARDAPGRPGG